MQVLQYLCGFPTHLDAHTLLYISGRMYLYFSTGNMAVALEDTNKERTMRRV